MQCPYLYESTREINQTTTDPGTNDQQTITMQSFKYLECKKEDCAAWRDGWCQYKG